MRRVSKKRKKLINQTREWRDELRNRVGRCEVCLQHCSAELLDVHELVFAPLRAKALDKPYAVLACHRRCHDYIETLTIPHQLAYLLRAAPERWNLEKYWFLCRRNWPDMEAVLYFLARLK